MDKFFFLTVSTIILATLAQGQDYSYSIDLEPVEIVELGGLQSYAFGTDEGNWLILGGRLDGLHMKQPFAAFDAAGNNNRMIVVDPESKEVWQAALNGLPSNVREQLSSTNMQFYQEGDRLMLIGGYAYSSTEDEHITFPFMTVLNVPMIIQAIKEGKPTNDFFQQIEDDRFAVTGGALEKMNDRYYLIGGHKFTGRYNPMGPDHGPGFQQIYTHEVRPFTVDFEDGLSINHEPAIHNELHLRRRDYNLLPQIRNGQQELMVFSGVFQPHADVPWLYPIAISETDFTPIEEFTQHFNHYRCANLPIYNSATDEMHNIFFGGIAQFYLDNGILVQDDDVPFVNTIADVVRLADGSLIELVQEEHMPALLGAGSELIWTTEAPIFSDGILNGDLIGEDPIALGYIYGGIKSDLPNIFWINDGSQSEASASIFKVSIRKKTSTAVRTAEDNSMKLLIYPNPLQQIVRLAFNMDQAKDMSIEIYSIDGKILSVQEIEKSTLIPGRNVIVLDNLNLGFGTFLYKIKMDQQQITRKVVVAE